ncbi:DUF4142 domain-containing protein [uncultured Pontibacter sp.]|uniref:DUF4142 domain-containing protein n=1 Tax=uncultured Pontibacter sp. TaxID=453356 RepID=UPI00261DF9C6|nr:DUF4142 domain-containing protein [uncultured Pontibacter sp.]
MFIDKLLSLAIGLLFLLVLSCDGPTKETDTKAPALTSQQTLANNPVFWDYAASSNMLQAEISRLAIEKGNSEQVVALAEKAASFHSNALQQLEAIASQHATIHLPDSLTGADSELVKEFEQLDVAEFNVRYRSFINSTHRAQLSRYDEALRKAKDKETREWLMALLSHLHEELEQLNNMDTLAEEPVR